MRRLKTPHGAILADDLVDGVPVNPRLPEDFNSTPNEDRPASHRKYWDVPYITTTSAEDWERIDTAATDEYAEQRRQRWADEGRAKWFEAWPGGTRYDVHCLDGGAWDRATSWGCFATVAEAVACSKAGPSWRR